MMMVTIADLKRLNFIIIIIVVIIIYHCLTCNLQPVTCNLQPATCNLQPATCNLQITPSANPKQAVDGYFF